MSFRAAYRQLCAFWCCSLLTTVYPRLRPHFAVISPDSTYSHASRFHEDIVCMHARMVLLFVCKHARMVLVHQRNHSSVSRQETSMEQMEQSPSYHRTMCSPPWLSLCLSPWLSHHSRRCSRRSHSRVSLTHQRRLLSNLGMLAAKLALTA